MKMPHIKTPGLPSGTEDFAKMRRCIDGKRFVIADKTKFLPELLNSTGDEVTVFARPIRFMKSSTLSMLDCFLSIQNADKNKALFDGLDISNEKYADFRAHYQGQFPVIYLNFKSVQARNWNDAVKTLNEIIGELYEKHAYVFSSLTERKKEQFQRIISGKSEPIELESALSNLATYLSKYYNKKVIILIDKYDTPIQRSHLHANKEERGQIDSYFDNMTHFLTMFLGNALKGHPNVERSFMTGVLRTAFSSLVSSLNNANVYSVLSPKFAELFGFTEKEVEYFISKIEGVSEKERDKIRELLKSWYNGYCIGGSETRMYNPWSVAQFFNNLPTSGYLAAQAHWLQKGDSLALLEFLKPRFDRLKPKITELMLGNTIKVRIDERTDLLSLDMPNDDQAFWGLLLHAGYLSASKISHEYDTNFSCNVFIPNHEVSGVYAKLINKYQQDCWLKDQDHGLSNYHSMIDYLREGDIDKFATHLQIYMEQSLSYYDLPKNTGANKKKASDESQQTDGKILEETYHTLMMGMIAGLGSKYFQVSSNREAGYGRYDILLIPHNKNKHGIIFEFKATDNPSKLASESENALEQIMKKRYAAALEASGVPYSIYLGISFCGKRVHVSHKTEKYSLQSK